MTTITEIRGFIFCVVFIVIFGALLSSIPTGLQGEGYDTDDLTPIDPSILSDFTDSENYTSDAFSLSGITYYYDYEISPRSFRAQTIDDLRLYILMKVIVVGFWWTSDLIEFISDSGTSRGTSLEWVEIDLDDDEGNAQYKLINSVTGENMGTLVAYWNTTTYSDIQDAWDDGELYFVHGVGFTTSATADIGALLVGLLLLQLPEVPPLLGIILATPIWSCIVYVLWFVIKEMIPFV